jgi:hypothetical protein
VSIELIARVLWHDTPATAVRRPELRRSRRYRVDDTLVTLWIACNESNRPQVPCTIVDVSTTGIGLRVPVTLTVGTVVAIETRSGFALGTVRRCDELGALFACGIALEDCPASRATVKALLRQAGLRGAG